MVVVVCVIVVMVMRVGFCCSIGIGSLRRHVRWCLVFDRLVVGDVRGMATVASVAYVVFGLV